MIIGNRFSLATKLLTVLYIGVYTTWWLLSILGLKQEVYVRFHGPIGLVVASGLAFGYWRLGRWLWRRMARDYITKKNDDHTNDPYTYLNKRWPILLRIEYGILGAIVTIVMLTLLFNGQLTQTGIFVVFLLAIGAVVDKTMRSKSYGQWIDMVRKEIRRL